MAELSIGEVEIPQPVVVGQGMLADTQVVSDRLADAFAHRGKLAGLQARHLVRSNRMLRASGRFIPVFLAKIWLHCNPPGERDKFADVTPFPLPLHQGIGVCADPDGYPRLPLLGARALRQHRLYLTIDYEKCRVSMRTPRRFWWFG